MTGPVAGLAAGTLLGVTLDLTGGTAKVVLTDIATSAIVGSLAGIPDVGMFIECLRSGVEYIAYIKQVDGGRVDVTVVRQDR